MLDLTPAFLSLKVALVATTLIFPLGVVTAWWLSHGRAFPGKPFVEALFYLPLVLPPTVTGFYLLLIFGRGTQLGRWINDSVGLHLIFTWQGAAVAASLMAFPLFVRTAASAFAAIDRSLLEAGRTLGASETALLTAAIVPISYRGIIAGLGLAFARALGEFGATLMIAGSIPGQTQTLPLALYDAVQAGNNSNAAAYTLILSLTAFVVLGSAGFYEAAIARNRRES